jgi:hypothetical protein
MVDGARTQLCKVLAVRLYTNEVMPSGSIPRLIGPCPFGFMRLQLIPIIILHTDVKTTSITKNETYYMPNIHARHIKSQSKKTSLVLLNSNEGSSSNLDIIHKENTVQSFQDKNMTMTIDGEYIPANPADFTSMARGRVIHIERQEREQ